jgi:tetratricopeptide (TPR) repeat protein
LDPARDYLAANNLSKVLEICDAALLKYSGLAEAHLLRGHALVGLGRNDDADISYQDAIIHDKHKPDAYWARIQLVQGNVESLLSRVDDLLVEFPRDQAARFNKAMALMQLQRIPESLPFWEELIEDDPANASSWGNKGAHRRQSSRPVHPTCLLERFYF